MKYRRRIPNPLKNAGFSDIESIVADLSARRRLGASKAQLKSDQIVGERDLFHRANLSRYQRQLVDFYGKTGGSFIYHGTSRGFVQDFLTGLAERPRLLLGYFHYLQARNTNQAAHSLLERFYQIPKLLIQETQEPPFYWGQTQTWSRTEILDSTHPVFRGNEFLTINLSLQHFVADSFGEQVRTSTPALTIATFGFEKTSDHLQFGYYSRFIDIAVALRILEVYSRYAAGKLEPDDFNRQFYENPVIT
jgi:hypothetical protein